VSERERHDPRQRRGTNVSRPTGHRSTRRRVSFVTDLSKGCIFRNRAGEADRGQISTPAQDTRATGVWGGDAPRETDQRITQDRKYQVQGTGNIGIGKRKEIWRFLRGGALEPRFLPPRFFY